MKSFLSSHTRSTQERLQVSLFDETHTVVAGCTENGRTSFHMLLLLQLLLLPTLSLSLFYLASSSPFSDRRLARRIRQKEQPVTHFPSLSISSVTRLFLAGRRNRNRNQKDTEPSPPLIHTCILTMRVCVTRILSFSLPLILHFPVHLCAPSFRFHPHQHSSPKIKSWRWQQELEVQHHPVEEHQQQDPECRCHGTPSCRDFRKRDVLAGESRTLTLVSFISMPSSLRRIVISLSACFIFTFFCQLSRPCNSLFHFI